MSQWPPHVAVASVCRSVLRMSQWPLHVAVASACRSGLRMSQWPPLVSRSVLRMLQWPPFVAVASVCRSGLRSGFRLSQYSSHFAVNCRLSPRLWQHQIADPRKLLGSATATSASSLSAAAACGSTFTGSGGSVQSAAGAVGTSSSGVGAAKSAGAAAQTAGAGVTCAAAQTAAAGVDSLASVGAAATASISNAAAAAAADKPNAAEEEYVPKWRPAEGDRLHYRSTEMYVWSARKTNIGCVFDDPTVPWQGFTREDVAREATVLGDPGEEEWLVTYSSDQMDPACLPVQAVVLGKVGTTDDGRKRPAGTLRGRATCHTLNLECVQKGWQIFMAYMPGVADNFAKAPVQMPFASGDTVGCRPPFVHCFKESDAVPREVAQPHALRDGMVLGICVGQERFKPGEGEGETTKSGKGELRRFVLVAFKGWPAPCFVQFERVTLCEAQHPPLPSKNLDERIDCCFEAASARSPSGLHQAFRTAQLQLNRAAIITKHKKSERGEGSKEGGKEGQEGQEGGQEGGQGEEGEEGKKGGAEGIEEGGEEGSEEGSMEGEEDQEGGGEEEDSEASGEEEPASKELCRSKSKGKAVVRKRRSARAAAKKKKDNVGDKNNKGKLEGEVKGSGVPLALASWGEYRLDKCATQQLLAALTENSLPQPPSSEQDKSGWAKDQLMRKFKGRGYSKYKNIAKEAAKEAERKKKATKEVAAKAKAKGKSKAGAGSQKGKAVRGKTAGRPIQITNDQSDLDDQLDESECGSGSTGEPSPPPSPPRTKRKQRPAASSASAPAPAPSAPAPAPAPALKKLKKGHVHFAAAAAPATAGVPAAEAAGAGLGEAVAFLAEMQRENLLLMQQMQDMIRRCGGGGT
eukprot:4257204-Pleurochrysis_carterae.AAC.1